jgi:plastocyanin
MRRIIATLLIVGATLGATSAVSGAAVPATKCSSNMHDSMDMGSKNCSSMDKNRPVVAGARVIPVTGDAFAFTPNTITIAAGENVTIKLTAQDVEHDVYVKGLGHVVHAKAEKAARGGLRIKKAGTYRFWCTVSGHKQAGMVGTITVT